MVTANLVMEAPESLCLLDLGHKGGGVSAGPTISSQEIEFLSSEI